MRSLEETYPIIIITNNMQQVALVFDQSAFMMIDDPQSRTRTLVEYGPNMQIIFNPRNKQTVDDVPIRFG